MAVGHTHDIGPFAAFGRSDVTPPFFAGTNVPSMKHSRRSKRPRSKRFCDGQQHFFHDSRTHPVLEAAALALESRRTAYTTP